MSDSVRLARAVQSFVDEAGKESAQRRERLRTIIGFALEYYRAMLRESGESAMLTAVSELDACLLALEQIDRNANIGLVVQNWCESISQIYSPWTGQVSTFGANDLLIFSAHRSAASENGLYPVKLAVVGLPIGVLQLSIHPPPQRRRKFLKWPVPMSCGGDTGHPVRASALRGTSSHRWSCHYSFSFVEVGRIVKRFLIQASAAALMLLLSVSTAAASEADLILPDMGSVSFLGGVSGRTLLMVGLAISFVGVGFGLVMFVKLRNLPVHRSMRDISELIYETCKTYLITQGKFILLLELFIGTVMVIYFGWLKSLPTDRVATIVAFSLVGIAGSYGVAWFGIRINTYANSRAAFASMRGKPFPVYAIPLQAGISIGTLLISVELAIMLSILLFVPRDYAGPCFIGFAIGESLGAAVLRIAGGIFTKIADIGADLMKIVFKIDEDDARNPGVIADCTGDNAGDSVGPTADGFETYGVTGVALIVFIMLAITPLYLPAGVTMKTATEAQHAAAQAAAAPDQVKLLVWIFVMRVLMVITSVVAYAINERAAKAKYEQADVMDFEKPLTSLVWLTSIISVAMTYIASVLLIHDLGDGTLWWKLATIITCGTLAGAIIPELVKIFTSTNSSHVKEVVASSREGGASLNILSGLTAGNFSAFWMGLVIAGLMGIAYLVAISGADAAGVGSLGHLMIAPSVFAFGLVAFGFLGMGPVTIAVDSYGPVADNAQSVFELSTIASQPNARREVKRRIRIRSRFRKRQALSSKKTTERAIRSRPRRNPCSLARLSSAQRR